MIPTIYSDGIIFNKEKLHTIFKPLDSILVQSAGFSRNKTHSNNVGI